MIYLETNMKNFLNLQRLAYVSLIHLAGNLHHMRILRGHTIENKHGLVNVIKHRLGQFGLVWVDEISD